MNNQKGDRTVMNSTNVTTLQKARSMCVLYGIVCLVVGLINFSILHEYGLGMIMVTIAILGFWRIAHKIKKVLFSENTK